MSGLTRRISPSFEEVWRMLALLVLDPPVMNAVGLPSTCAFVNRG